MSSYTLTLPGPSITASVTLPQVRACMEQLGWRYTGATDDGGGEAWERGGTLRLVIYNRDRHGREALASIQSIVLVLAKHIGVSPGELLLRISVG